MTDYKCKINTLLAFIVGMLSISVSSAQQLQAAHITDIDDRLNYLNSRLSNIQTPATYWQYGWTGFYGISGAAQLTGAIAEEDNDNKTVLYVGAVKSFGGLGMMLLRPLPVVSGLDDLNQIPGETEQQKYSRLVATEKLLEESAKRADERYTMKPHLIGILVNLLGAGAIMAWGDSDDALGSAALGIVINEAAIWTQPSPARQYWLDYQRQFNGVGQNSLKWRVVPGINSVALEVAF